MEKLCKIRDLQRTIIEFELSFEKEFGISLNEGMTLCTLLKTNEITSGAIGEALGLTSSNTSKVIASLEKKGYIVRKLGLVDRRQILINVTDSGIKLLAEIKNSNIVIPNILNKFLES